MLFFAVGGGIILILAVMLGWRDHRARRQGSQISYRGDKMRQSRFDTDVATHNPMFVRNRHDWMSQPPGDRDGNGDRAPAGERPTGPRSQR